MLVSASLACGSEDQPSSGSFNNMPNAGAGGSTGSQPVGGAAGTPALGGGGQPSTSVGGTSSEMNPPVMGISGSGGTGATPAQGGSAGAPQNTGGAGGTGGQQLMVAMNFPDCPPFPPNNGQQSVGSTMELSGTFDGGMRRFVGTGDLGGSDQEEGQDPLFELANNTTLRNVIIGSPAADGIHCEGNCTLENVWWEDVGEDAATFRGGDSTRVTIDCGGARAAVDKVLQHNGGGTVVINDFYVENFGKLYRSCGNCDESFDRHVEITNLLARAPGDALVGVNSNFGDTAILRNVFLIDSALTIQPCERYTGTTSGNEPVRNGVGPDGQTCRYQPSDVVYVLPPP